MLSVGDKFEIGGGYDMDPPWLSAREGRPFRGEVLRFLDNGIEGRKEDERISAIVRFEEELEFTGLRSRYGILVLRYEKQRWGDSGTVHVHLVREEPIESISLTSADSRWLESHASYQKMANKALEPTPSSVTPRACARVAPAAVVAHL